MIDALPADQREQTKSFLAQSLIAVITQVLIKRPEGRGRTRGVRGHADEPRDREADPDGPVAPDPCAAADRQGRRHGADGPGAAARDQGEGGRSRTTPTPTPRTSACSRSSSWTAACCRSSRQWNSGAGPCRRSTSTSRKSSSATARTCTSWPGDPPRIRQYGKLASLRAERLAADYVREAIYEIMPRKALDRFETRDGTDFAYSLGTLARFRVNVLRQLNGLGAVFRAIPSKAQTLEQLKMPEAVRSLAKVSNGLILVTGKTGSGKSTTLAAMIDDLNSRIKGHILTIEDPIEFVHPRKNCLISQREVGVARRVLRDRAALGPARGPGRHPGRRAARPRDDLDRDHRRRDGHPRDGDAAHERRGGDRGPHRQRLPGGQAEPRAHDALDLAARRRLAAADLAQGRPGTGRRARGPDQYAGGGQPDPPGQDRPARVGHAVERGSRHAHDGLGDRAAATTRD